MSLVARGADLSKRMRAPSIAPREHGARGWETRSTDNTTSTVYIAWRRADAWWWVHPDRMHHRVRHVLAQRARGWVLAQRFLAPHCLEEILNRRLRRVYERRHVRRLLSQAGDSHEPEAAEEVTDWIRPDLAGFHLHLFRGSREIDSRIGSRSITPVAVKALRAYAGSLCSLCMSPSRRTPM